MSKKAMGAWKMGMGAIKNAPQKFTPNVQEGSRIVPSRNKDAELQCRIDAGHYDAKTKKLNVVLQVNSQATSPTLKKWARQNTTHGKLATAEFDTSVKDKNGEYDRVIDELYEKGIENLKKRSGK